MTLVSMIAFGGAILAAVIGLPQYLLVVRTKDTHGLSLTAWIIAVGTGAGWLGHGIRIGEIHMIWPNIWGLFVAFTILYYLRRNKHYTSYLKLWPGLALAGLLFTLDAFIGSAAFGIAIMIPQVYGILRQGVALMKAPQVTGVSLATWIFQLLCQSLWLVWAIMTSEPGTLICATVSAIACTFTLTWRILRAIGFGPIGNFRRQPSNHLAEGEPSVVD